MDSKASRCLDCNVKLRNQNALRCRPCHTKSRQPRPTIKLCLDCQVKLSPWAHKAGTKRCRKCAKRTPEQRAITAHYSKQRYIDRPELRQANRDRLNALLPTLEPKREASRDRWRASVKETRMGWCPEQYRALYEKLRKRQIRDPATKKIKVFGAVNARKQIEKKIGGPLQIISMTFPQSLRNECTLGGKVTKLAPQETRLIEILLLSPPNYIIGNSDMIERMWPNPDDQPDSAQKVVDQLIYRLRAKGVRILSNGHGKGSYIPAHARAK